MNEREKFPLREENIQSNTRKPTFVDHALPASFEDAISETLDGPEYLRNFNVLEFFKQILSGLENVKAFNDFNYTQTINFLRNLFFIDRIDHETVYVYVKNYRLIAEAFTKIEHHREASRVEKMLDEHGEKALEFFEGENIHFAKLRIELGGNNIIDALTKENTNQRPAHELYRDVRLNLNNRQSIIPNFTIVDLDVEFDESFDIESFPQTLFIWLEKFGIDTSEIFNNNWDASKIGAPKFFSEFKILANKSLVFIALKKVYELVPNRTAVMRIDKIKRELAQFLKESKFKKHLSEKAIGVLVSILIRHVQNGDKGEQAINDLDDVMNKIENIQRFPILLSLIHILNNERFMLTDVKMKWTNIISNLPVEQLDLIEKRLREIEPKGFQYDHISSCFVGIRADKTQNKSAFSGEDLYENFAAYSEKMTSNRFSTEDEKMKKRSEINAKEAACEYVISLLKGNFEIEKSYEDLLVNLRDLIKKMESQNDIYTIIYEEIFAYLEIESLKSADPSYILVINDLFERLKNAYNDAYNKEMKDNKTLLKHEAETLWRPPAPDEKTLALPRNDTPNSLVSVKPGLIGKISIFWDRFLKALGLRKM